MQTTVQCHSDVGVVSWEASFGVVGYVVSLAGRDGHSLSCSTNETFCTVEGLHCGVIYYTKVIAIGETTNSDESTTVLLVSGMLLSNTGFIIVIYYTMEYTILYGILFALADCCESDQVFQVKTLEDNNYTSVKKNSNSLLNFSQVEK